MKTTLYALIISISLIACSKDKKVEKAKMSDNNPFNTQLNQPIDYANVTSDDVVEYANVVIKNAALDIEEIKKIGEPNLDNTFVAFDDVQNSLSIANNNAFMLYWASTDSLTRAKGLEYSKKIDSVNTVINSDKELYNQFEKFSNSTGYTSLQGHRKRFVDDIIENFKLSGVNLENDKLEAFKKLKAEISDLTSRYSINMNTADDTLKLDSKGAEGLPETIKNTYKVSENNYEIPVINATSGPIMSNAKSEQTRKEFYVKFNNRGASKNLTILDSLISKRYQLAKIMGYDTYAAYNLVPKMAKNPKNVWNFLNDLVDKSKDKAIHDVEVLDAMRNKEQHEVSDNPVKPWNISYYNNQILKTKYDVDGEKLREYLPMDACLKGMMAIYEKLLGLQFKKIENASVWSPDVELYDVYEGDKLKGRFYLDLYPRPNKESWFYGMSLSNGKSTQEGYQIPVRMLLGNFTKPTKDLPSLLSYGELNTLFHEFGHIMEGVSYEGEYSLQQSSKRDFAEAMSQMFENWIRDYSVVSSFAKHYKTGEVLPKTMFDNLKNAKNLSSGLGLQRSLRYCIYDMNLYDKYNPEHPINTDSLWVKIDDELGVLPLYVEGTHPQSCWIHINTHPVYMYGYLWSEVYAQDMFTVFEKNGLEDTKTGIRYRKLILANGSQHDIVKQVEEFLGRPSNNKAYLKSLGLE
ncbi:oligopeptidase A [Yeosuana aromativorans]|uniref:Oligopeptidase A n=1 Tax=Yeosuana aromativorans TaxID=288019 RepID=A0A8J3FEG8_9FLAO|nr:M3 family metallopeptidase [Yeosuana aromativorans]GGK16836.1 oligopeptidase A [Yeosuana aromativorans]